MTKHTFLTVESISQMCGDGNVQICFAEKDAAPHKAFPTPVTRRFHVGDKVCFYKGRLYPYVQS